MDTSLSVTFNLLVNRKKKKKNLIFESFTLKHIYLTVKKYRQEFF